MASLLMLTGGFQVDLNVSLITMLFVKNLWEKQNKNLLKQKKTVNFMAGLDQLMLRLKMLKNESIKESFDD